MRVRTSSRYGAERLRRRRAVGSPEGRDDRAQPRRTEPPGDRTIASARLRRADAPQDQARYSCVCGFVFEAEVSTSVGCPHCGTSQAW